MSLPIVTPRLRLRPYTAADIPRIHEVLYGDARSAELVGGVSSLVETSATIAECIDGQRRDGYAFWAVVERATGLVIGEAGLKPFVDGSPEVELGYAFGAPWWGRGYATEAGRAILAEAFGPLGLARVVAVTRDDNAGSLRVLAKLGFVAAGRRAVYGGDMGYFVRERG